MSILQKIRSSRGSPANIANAEKIADRRRETKGSGGRVGRPLPWQIWERVLLPPNSAAYQSVWKDGRVEKGKEMGIFYKIMGRGKQVSQEASGKGQEIKKRRGGSKTAPYDKETMKPVIHASICTGERAAGFKNLATGKFQEVMLLRKEEDLQAFKKRYGIEEELETEW